MGAQEDSVKKKKNNTEPLSADVCVSRRRREDELLTLGENLRRGRMSIFNKDSVFHSICIGGGNAHLLHTESIVLAVKTIQLAHPGIYPFLERMPVKSLEQAELRLNT